MVYQPPRARSNDKHDAIVAASREHFLADGFAGTRMEPIAKSAKVSTATVYAYFPGKEDLFEAMVAATVDELKPRFPPDSSHQSARQKLMQFSLAGTAFLSHPDVRALFRLVIAEGQRFERSRELFLRETLAYAMADGSALIGALTRAGDLVDCDPAMVTRQLMGMVEHEVLLLAMLAANDRLSLRPAEDICGEAVDVILRTYGSEQLHRTEAKVADEIDARPS